MPSEERRKEISQFVRVHPGTSEGEVIRHMSEIQLCSRDTTRATIRILVQEGKIKLRNDKRKNNRTHHLYINEVDQYNFIDQELSKIEATVAQWIEATDKLAKTSYESREDYIASRLNEYIHGTCKTILQFILNGLLILTSKSIQSETDSQLLYPRIAKLILKLNPQYLKEVIDGEHYQLLLKQFYDLPPEDRTFAKSRGINVDLAKNMVTEMMNLKNNLQRFR